MACDYGVVTELLLTWSEVEACRDPCRFRCHQRQQKPSHARSCSSIFLPLRGNSTNGEPLSEALLRWSPWVDAPTESHAPVAGKPARRDVTGDEISIASS